MAAPCRCRCLCPLSLPVTYPRLGHLRNERLRESQRLFIALLFFGWLWGAWGLLLGAPLVAVAKVICDRVESLKPAGELLGR